MSLRPLLHLVEPALHALPLDEVVLNGLQLYHAARLVDFHHPPLNPDFPALLLTLDAFDLARIRAVLLNQYPGTYPLQVMQGAALGVVTVESWTLDQLEQASVTCTDQAEQWLAIYIPPLPLASSFERFQETIAHLRAPEGCPWDRKQTHRSLRPYLLEETYEVLDALDADDTTALCEELGDLLLQIVLHSQVAVDAGTFRMTDVIAAVNAKLIRRHPHVWGSVTVNDEQDVKVNWDQLKQAEKNTKDNGEQRSRLDGVSGSLPALSQAYSYQARAARVKFDWETIEPVIAKIHEEIEEVAAAPDTAAREQETGDLLFAVVNWARWLGIEPESALRASNARFYRRFHYIERQAAVQGRAVDDMSLDEMDALWEAAKAEGL